MQKRADADWVGYVLRDVVTFLAENEMMQSAQMLAVAAAHIEHDIKRGKLPDVPTVRREDPKVVAFPGRQRFAN
jgi:hypothetical protein